MKKLIVLFSIVLLFSGLKAQVNIGLPTLSGNAGEIVTVPVTAGAGFDQDDIAAFSLSVNYLTSKISHLEVADLNADLNSLGDWTNNPANDGSIEIIWVTADGMTPCNLAEGAVICNLKFIANQGGLANLTFSNVEFVSPSGNILPYSETTGSLTFGAPQTTTSWNGTGSWYTAANWSNGFPGSSTNAVIASGIVTIDANPAFTKNLTVNANAGVTVNSGKALAMSGNLVLESSANSDRTGTFLNNSTALLVTTSGTVTAKRWFEGGKSHMVSIPVTAATINNFFVAGNTGYFYKYNEVSNAWDNLWELSTQLNIGVGYLVDYTTSQTISVTSPLNNDASYSPTVTRTAANGWNLVGNPYPTSLDWSVASGWTKTNLDNAIYIWNGTQYASYVGTTGTNGGSKFIAPFQGFFVHASANSPAISIKKAARTHQAVSYFKSTENQTLRIALSGLGSNDESVICVSDTATTDFDSNMDAYKLLSLKSDVAGLYTMINDVNYSINSFSVNDRVSVNIAVVAPQSGEYNLSFTGFDGFNSAYSFMLEDKETGIVYNVKNNSNLSFNVVAGTNQDRFVLTISRNATGINDQLDSNNCKVYAQKSTLYFENCENMLAVVYDVTGKIISEITLGNNQLETKGLNVTSGIYMVKVTGEKSSKSFKVFIQ